MLRASCWGCMRCATWLGMAIGTLRAQRMDRMRFPILWQAPSAMYFKPAHHLGGYGCLLAEMRMMMCGGLGGLAVEKSDGVAIA